jgi:hypothetical protein
MSRWGAAIVLLSPLPVARRTSAGQLVRIFAALVAGE